MRRLVAGATLAAWAVGATGHAEAMDMGRVFVEGGLGQVFGSDLEVDGAAQPVEGDPNAFVAIGLADVGGSSVDVRLEYATTDRYYENSFFAQLQSSSVMLNATYDVPAGPVDFYAGGGLGVIEVEFHGMPGFFDGVEGGETKFGWQAVGGARAKLFDWPLAAFGEVRYQDAGTASIDEIEVEYNSVSAMAGLRWTF